MSEKEPKLEQEETKNCSECKFLFFERYSRCSLFDGAIIEDVEEKNCES
jgi:hypothetical protein